MDVTGEGVTKTEGVWSKAENWPSKSGMPLSPVYYQYLIVQSAFAYSPDFYTLLGDTNASIITALKFKITKHIHTHSSSSTQPISHVRK
jgi:hypothetical protein